MSPNVAETLQYRHVRNTALPYVTASAPTSTNPQYVDGLNVLTSYKGYLERRPGFATGLESTPTTFAGPVKRVFGWRRWNSTFFIMLNEIEATQSKVYKLAVGIDASFVLIWTSASTNVFDFVVSNNFCFFGNGLDMKKYDGTTVWNWGIEGPSTAFVGPKEPTTASTNDGGLGYTLWTNPNNILLHDGSFATCPTGGTVYHASSPVVYYTSTGVLVGGTYGFAIPAGATLTGFIVEASVKTTEAGGTLNASGFQISAHITKAGSPVGSLHQSLIYALNGTAQYYSLGNSTDLWGSTWTPAEVNAAGFGIYITIVNRWSVPSGTYTLSTVTNYVDDIRITVYYSYPNAGIPTVSLSGTGITATNGGYQYVYSYFNSTTGHISSPSSASASTGNFANKTVNVGVTASTDPQVDQIRIFRTTDGGGGVYFEITNSPVANATTTYPDTTTDANLSVITAPTYGFNDPPPAQQGFVWFANRIWGFFNNTVYFTDWEELNIGVAEESCTSGPAGNYWNFDSEVTGLSVAQDGVIIFTAGSIYKIDGDSLNTFRRTTIAKGIGCRNRATIARLGALTAFLANTNSIWTTDSNSLNEISQMIQPTLDNIDHTQASATFHIQGQNRWLLFCDAGHNQTLCYDTNTQQWMPPWSIVATACTSAETTAGNWDLLIGQETTNKMLQLTPSAYLDNGATYSAFLKTNPQPIINEHLGSGSAYIDLYYPQNPGQVAYMEYFGADFNAILPDDILYELDDDPATATYISIVANETDAPLKTQGINVVNKWYYSRKPTGRRISIQVQWLAANSNFKLYTYSVAYRIYR